MVVGEMELKTIISIIILLYEVENVIANDILGCGGFVKSHVPLDFAKIEIGLYTKEGSLKEKTECAPTNGYYFLPLYEKGEYVLKVHPPAGWSFEPSEVNLVVDGTSDQCSIGQDINFAFNGFGIAGRVVTAGQKQGPRDIAVQLIDEKGDIRKTTTTVGGDFHFTPVIPGKYTVKASHPRWKLEPSQAVVQVKEGNTALPVGVLTVKGYDVRGSVTSFGAPLSGLYVLLYSKESTQQFRVEGCQTALLQGVPDSPICYSVTDNNGEFNFGIVPAGHYKLLALATPPGQIALSYNVKPDKVAFSVQHDSLYIKNAFEVKGFTVISSVLSSVGGSGLSGVRVLLDDRPVGNTDTGGKYTLPNLQPGTYTLSFQHEQCEIEPVQLVVTSAGPGRYPAAVAARWRVCGGVSPPAGRLVAILTERGATVAAVAPDDQGKWCTFLQPGVYSANVELSEQEQRDGMQFFPMSQKVVVSQGPVSGVSFSQLKGTVRGRVRCLRARDCAALPVYLRPLAPGGSYQGHQLSGTAQDGEYSFPEVTAGSAEVSVGGARLCWRERSHVVAVAHERVTAPDFEHTGYVLRVRASHPMQLEYSGPDSKGVLSVREGASEQCVPSAGRYTLTPRACHQFSPASAAAATSDTDDNPPKTINFVATAHEVTVRILSPEAAPDLVLYIGGDGRPETTAGPLAPRPHPDGGYSYEHTLYMADGEVAVVWGKSSTLVVEGGAPRQLVGRAWCQSAGLTLRARAGRTLQGVVRPPVPGALVSLSGEGVSLSQTIGADGKYKFGPLDASKQYVVSAALESYVFSEPDSEGNIAARKLAEITVRLLDEAGLPLQGGLVSVSGGSYRRTAAAGSSGLLRFPALAPDNYYVKPHMKEYRFEPPHTLVPLPDGESRTLELRGVRVAWSCVGRLVSLGGVGWAAAVLVAAPQPGQRCTSQDGTTDDSGAFRIRGLLPECVYTIQLKESSSPELAGLKLAKAPPILEVKDKKDIEDVILIGVQQVQLTDGSVLVTAAPDHYKSLRLTLATQNSPHSPLYSTKLDPSGLPSGPPKSPGLMFVLPRLPADNTAYVLTLESTLSKLTHSYEETVIYFNSDGSYKQFDIDFAPTVKSSEQELRQTSLLVVPLVGLLVVAYIQREAVLEGVGQLVARAGRSARGAGPGPGGRASPLLDRASIDHIVSAVNAAGRQKPKRKFI